MLSINFWDEMIFLNNIKVIYTILVGLSALLTPLIRRRFEQNFLGGKTILHAK